MGDTVYDSIYAKNLPADTTRALTYIDGNWPTNFAVLQRFPNCATYTLTVGTSLVAQGIDIEKGNGDAQDAANFAEGKLMAGDVPGIYCSRIGEPGYGWPDVQTALIAKHISPTQVDWLCADITGEEHLVEGSALTQWGQGPDGSYDISVTNGTFMAGVPQPEGIDMSDATRVWNPESKQMESQWTTPTNDVCLVTVVQGGPDNGKLRYDILTAPDFMANGTAPKSAT